MHRFVYLELALSFFCLKVNISRRRKYGQSSNQKMGNASVIGSRSRNHLPASVYKGNVLSADPVSDGADKRTDGSSVIRLCDYGNSLIFYRRCDR